MHNIDKRRGNIQYYTTDGQLHSMSPSFLDIAMRVYDVVRDDYANRENIDRHQYAASVFNLAERKNKK